MGKTNKESQYVREYKTAYKIAVNDMALAILEEYSQNKEDISPTRVYEIAEEVKAKMEAEING